MHKNRGTLLFLLVAIATIFMTTQLASHHSLSVLQPAGVVGAQERSLMLIATILMLVVVVPVFILTLGIVWRYRASNLKATYTPEWDHSTAAEAVWWGLPCLIILVLAVVTWQSTHQLDPSKVLASDKKPMTIQVVALQWRWLFIYPEQRIASLNMVQFPVDTPVTFELTADAPMNSFWIPQLGGQMYAMPGMTTQLNLMASAPGEYQGVSANLSGKGFSGMHFTAKASTDRDFTQWVYTVQHSANILTNEEYAKLAQPSENTNPAYYAGEPKDLYTQILGKFMLPKPQPTSVPERVAEPNSTMTPTDMPGMQMQ